MTAAAAAVVSAVLAFEADTCVVKVASPLLISIELRVVNCDQKISKEGSEDSHQWHDFVSFNMGRPAAQIQVCALKRNFKLLEKYVTYPSIYYAVC